MGWFEPKEARALDTDLVQDALGNVKLIQDWLRMTQSRQKSYTDRKVRDVSFMVREKAGSKVEVKGHSFVESEVESSSTSRGYLGDQEEMQSSYPRLFETPVILVFESIKACQYDDPYFLVVRDTVKHCSAKEVTIGDDGVLQIHGSLYVPNVDVLRELILEEAHSAQYTIHQKYHEDKSHILEFSTLQLDENLAYEEEPMAILNRRTRQLRSKEIMSVKVQWRGHIVKEVIWETEHDM
ncbi:uncharacterized protein [Nicotiana tomentosiformis]|uniref:uncharacterized protein n=1 Tax=Nicotiana tomentosiformis TaxID=4098 RepID=UPI00388CD76B